MWILIVLFVAGNGISALSQEFNSEEACKAAIEALDKTPKKGFLMNPISITQCVRKD
jgi:hypothetical protein